MKKTNVMLIGTILVLLVGGLAFMQAGKDPYVAGAEDAAHDAGHTGPDQQAQAPSMDDLEKQVGAGGEGPVQGAVTAPGEKFTERRDPTQPANIWYRGARNAKSGTEMAKGGKIK